MNLPEAFEPFMPSQEGTELLWALRHRLLPELFSAKQGRPVRVWVPRCSSGQRAYWIAMVLTEYVELHGLGNDIQIFATDVDCAALSRAREGTYPASSAESLPEGYRARYFQQSDAGLQVSRRLRDCLLFSRHDLSKDPPFSKLDLILGLSLFRDLAENADVELAQMLHFASFPKGWLLLEPGLMPRSLPAFFSGPTQAIGFLRGRTDRLPALPASRMQPYPRRLRHESGLPPNDSDEVTAIANADERMLLTRYAPACVVLDEAENVPSFDHSGQPSEVPLATRRRAERVSSQNERPSSSSSSDELRILNEALVSLNEELQLANEELQASRDELQGVNEELETVNGELKASIAELQHANDHSRNLIEATRLAVLSLDVRLRIVDFTPAIQDLFSLNQGDCGRPFADIAQRFQYDDLSGDALEVMRARSPKETQVRSLSKRWYIFRIVPYVSEKDVLEGVLLTFNDVTELKLTALELARVNGARGAELQHLRSLVDAAPVGIAFHDAESGVLRLNRRATELLGVELLDREAEHSLPFCWPAEVVPTAAHADLRRVTMAAGNVEALEIVVAQENEEPRRMLISAAPLQAASAGPSSTVTCLFDVTGRRAARGAHER